MATAILDRLLHHSHVLTIRGDSYRLRDKRRSGLLKRGSADASSETAQRNCPVLHVGTVQFLGPSAFSVQSKLPGSRKCLSRLLSRTAFADAGTN